MRTIAVKARDLLDDVWEMIKIVATVVVPTVRLAVGSMGVMFGVTLGLTVLYAITGNAALLGVALLFSYRWGQLTVEDSATCEACGEELEEIK